MSEFKTTFAVGDIHGQLDLFRAVRDGIRRRLDSLGGSAARVVLLGDYIDRGPAGLGVVDEILDWKRTAGPGLRIETLMANHEQMLRLILDPRIDVSVVPFLLGNWFENGGNFVLAEAGLSDGAVADLYASRDGEAIRRTIREAIGERRAAFFLEELSDHILDPDTKTLYVHGGIDWKKPHLEFLSIPWHEYTEYHWCWIRKGFLDRDASTRIHESNRDLFVVHGHTPELGKMPGEAPTILPWRLNLDARAFGRNAAVYAAELSPDGIRALAVGRNFAPVWHDLPDPRPFARPTGTRPGL